jgi:hypothetical protein
MYTDIIRAMMRFPGCLGTSDKGSEGYGCCWRKSWAISAAMKKMSALKTDWQELQEGVSTDIQAAREIVRQFHIDLQMAEMRKFGKSRKSHGDPGEEMACSDTLSLKL